MKHFDSAMDMLNHLDNSIDVSHSSMKDIAESTESTADAIQQQAIMCTDIQEHTDAAESGIHEMIESSRRTDATVREGAEVVRELKEQAQSVEVQNFVGSIISISNQTNLLALNASI